MSAPWRQRFKITAFVSGGFLSGLLIAGAFDLPAWSSAQQISRAAPAPQQSAQATPAARVSDAPPSGAAGLESLSEAFAAVAEHVKPSVVYIKSEITAHRDSVPAMRIPPGFEPFFRGFPGTPGGPQQRPQFQEASGSGFIVSPDGYILTNAHVVADSKRVTVRLLDRREFTAKVVGTDPTTDVAVLKIDADNLTPAALGNSDSARVGEWVLAVGNPLGDNLTFTVTQGIISAKARSLNLPNRTDRSIQDFIQTDAAINPGNSGGPLVGVRGEVVGINSAIASETGFYSGYGFAIPINLARQVMDQLIHGGKVHRAALGVLVRDATTNDAQYVGLSDVRGVVVQDFTPEGKAAKDAGLEPGDIIIAVNGQPVEYTAQLQQRIAFQKPGETVKITVARKGGVRKTFPVPLQNVPEKTELASANDSNNSSDDNGASAPLATLGVSVAPLDQSTAEQFGLPNDVKGVVVTDVRPGGPSYESIAGPENGGPDIIQSVEGHAVKSPQDLRNALKGDKAGEIVSLRIYNARAKTHRVERIRLGEPGQ
ncbi:MAG TPA: Do family serine endopeptidase [Gemmatimonadales bacterium]|nr:Do family serine endopeptidase [Gemmatimonadales bacterium]